MGTGVKGPSRDTSKVFVYIKNVFTILRWVRQNIGEKFFFLFLEMLCDTSRNTLLFKSRYRGKDCRHRPRCHTDVILPKLTRAPLPVYPTGVNRTIVVATMYS